MAKLYTVGEIERIISERVKVIYHEPTLKKGLIAEWSFEYPTGDTTVEVEYSFPMYSENHDAEIAKGIIKEKIARKVWEICGKYTLATGDKL